MTASQPPAPKPSPPAGQHAEEPGTSTASTTVTASVSAPAPRHAAEPSVGQLVAEASEHVSTLIRSEIELAKLELRATVKNAGTGAGFFSGAAVVVVFSLTFAFFALAEGLAALGLSRWLAFLIVFLFQLAIAAVCVWLGLKKVKKVRAPERTIRTTRETVDYLKNARG